LYNAPDAHCPVSLNDFIVPGMTAPTGRFTGTAIEPEAKNGIPPATGQSARAAQDQPKSTENTTKACTNKRATFNRSNLSIPCLL
jgi:hypothetical protein